MVYYVRAIGKYRDSIGKREGGGRERERERGEGGDGGDSNRGNMDDAVSIGRFKDRRIRSFKRTRVESRCLLTTTATTRSERRHTGVSPRCREVSREEIGRAKGIS